LAPDCVTPTQLLSLIKIVNSASKAFHNALKVLIYRSDRSHLIILDSGPLGMIANPKAASAICKACQQWLESLLSQGHTIVIPEIADYEIRRELLRTNRTRSIKQLEQVTQVGLYLPIATDAMKRVAQLWAIVRQSGQPTADPRALDGDVILAAQVLEGFAPELNPIVATGNTRHLARFVSADDWQNIS
jgi:predicted nucleic acid-binding protein